MTDSKHNVETERKFLLLGDVAEWSPFLTNEPAAWEMRQAYLALPSAAMDVEVRIRAARRVKYPVLQDASTEAWVDENGDPATVHRLGFKRDISTGGGGGLSRLEEEIDVDESEFKRLWRLTEGRRIRKTRVEYMVDIPDGGPRVVTVDDFSGHLKGLRLAEIEFGSWNDSSQFTPPGFLGIEVTHDRRYRNSALAIASGPPPDDAATSDNEL